MTKRLVIIGASGHGKVAADCAELLDQYSSIVFLDDRYPSLSALEHWDVVGVSANAEDYEDHRTTFFVAIGNNKIREKVYSELEKAKLPLSSLVHPSAIISAHSSIGEGTLVCANTAVNAFSNLGKGVILNTGASVDHDCSVGDYVHIGPGCRIAGQVNIGKGSFLGVASAAVQCLNIGEYSILGAGSTLLQSLPANATAVGSPAKIIKQ
jgi:sugar O-acyltransferase (sialic acid O-acetyltransferase NeuD family)